VNIVVSDMERSLAFYRLLGAEIEEIDGQWRPHHSTIVGIAPQVTVELYSEVRRRIGLPPGTTSERVAFRWG
jgi:catechol 2,3-dioxygenase-like lactoylglutathione lyase family enzyme